MSFQFKSTIDALGHWAKNTPDTPFLIQNHQGHQTVLSYKESWEEAAKMATQLRNLQLPERSHVAIFSKNCSHWILADMAVAMAGYVSIPIYPTLTADGINQILTHSESKAIIVGKLDQFDTQKEGIPNIPIISVKAYGGNTGLFWEDLVANAEALEQPYQAKPEELHTIIYTSGTTGNPKGVMHTVGNFSQSSITLTNVINLPTNPKFFSYLPLAHVAERLIYNGITYFGGQITFAYSLESFAEDLAAVQPDFFFAVPRIWTKFQEKILENLPQRKLSILLKIPIIGSVLKSKIAQKLGLSNATFIASAAAPISKDLVKWYGKIGIQILQGYGMTEDGCVSHFNMPHQNKIGTVGKALENVSIKFSEEGEILIKNRCLFKGYFKAPEITQEVFDKEGYFKTGDIGEYDHERYLTLTGRVKDQFKTDKGKYISPSPMELILSKNTDIEQICVVGTSIPQPIAMVTVSAIGKAKSTNALNQSLWQSVLDINPTLEKHELIKKVVIMPEPWTVDNGFSTPTLKVKRNVLEKVYQPLYATWFHQDENVIHYTP